MNTINSKLKKFDKFIEETLKEIEKIQIEIIKLNSKIKNTKNNLQNSIYYLVEVVDLLMENKKIIEETEEGVLFKNEFKEG